MTASQIAPRTAALSCIFGAAATVVGGLVVQGIVQRGTAVSDEKWSYPWSSSALVPVSLLWASLHVFVFVGLLGFARSDAARFSFLLSIPAVAGAGILEARKAFVELGSEAIPALAVGTGVAAVVGYASIAWFLRWLGSHQLTGFAVYRIVAGLALLAALAARVIRP